MNKKKQKNLVLSEAKDTLFLSIFPAGPKNPLATAQTVSYNPNQCQATPPLAPRSPSTHPARGPWRIAPCCRPPSTPSSSPPSRACSTAWNNSSCSGAPRTSPAPRHRQPRATDSPAPPRARAAPSRAPRQIHPPHACRESARPANLRPPTRAPAKRHPHHHPQTPRLTQAQNPRPSPKRPPITLTQSRPYCSVIITNSNPLTNKSFLVLFFKKEPFPFPC